MHHETKRTLVRIGIFAVVPVLVLGFMGDFKNSPGYSTLLFSLIALTGITMILRNYLTFKSICPNCAKRYFPVPLWTFVSKSGCDKCGHIDNGKS